MADDRALTTARDCTHVGAVPTSRRCAARGTSWPRASTSAPRPRRRARCSATDVVLYRTHRRRRSSPRPTAARTARRRCRWAPSTTAASCARTTAGRSATTAAACGCRRPPSTCRRPAAGAPRRPYTLRRAVRPGVGVPRRHRRRRIPRASGRAARDDPTFRRINTPRRRVADVGHPHDRQLPRHHPLPVRARRHVRHGPGHAGAQARDWSRSTTAGSATATRCEVNNSDLGTLASRAVDAEVVDARDDDRASTCRSPCAAPSTTTPGLEHILLLLSTPDRRRHVVLHVRRVAQRRLLGVGRGGHPLRPGDRRRGQADARAGARRAAPRPDHAGQRAGRQGSVEWRRRLVELARLGSAQRGWRTAVDAI